MKAVAFTPDAEALVASIVCQPIVDVEYDLKFWTKGKTKKLKQLSGSFADEVSDDMSLGTPTASWDGRLVNFVATAAVPSGGAAARLSLVVRQGSKELGSDFADVPPGSDGVTHIVYLRLVTGA